MTLSFARTAAFGLALSGAATAQAASHREAPITALDHKADITDVYAFVSFDNSDKVTLIMNVDPLLEPSNGPADRSRASRTTASATA